MFRKNSPVKYCDKLLICEIYKKLFKSKQALVGHHNSKHMEKFKCDLWEKCFDNILKLDRHKMTRNVETSFTGPKCGKKFLRKDNMLQLVKRSVNVLIFYYNISWLYLQTVLLLIILKFWFCFCKILCITYCWSTCFLCRRDVHVNNFFHVALFKLIGWLSKLLVLTILCLFQLPILDFLLESWVGWTLIFVCFLSKKCGTKNLKCRNILVFSEWSGFPWI